MIYLATKLPSNPLSTSTALHITAYNLLLVVIAYTSVVV